MEPQLLKIKYMFDFQMKKYFEIKIILSKHQGFRIFVFVFILFLYIVFALKHTIFLISIYMH